MNRTMTIFFVMLASCVTSFAEQPAATGKPSIVSGDPSLLPDQEIGRRFLVPADDLPAPKATPVASSRSFVLPYAGQVPHVPDGFEVTLFAGGLEHPRRLLVLPNGDIIVAEQRVFYEGDQFPTDFKGDAFVALRGLRVYRSRVRRSLKSSDTRVIKYQHEPPRQLGAVTEERHLRRGRIRVAKPKL